MKKDPELILMLQCYPGDVDNALELTKLMVEIEPAPRTDVEFILAHTREVDRHFAAAIVEQAKKRFPVARAMKGKRFGKGWPNGSNDLWQDCMTQLSMGAKAGKIKATGVLTFEPDCLPLRADWIDILKAEWERARRLGFQVCGHLHYGGNESPTHFNGNGIFGIRVISDYPELRGGGDHGWDWLHAKTLTAIGVDTNAIFQIYQQRSITKDKLLGIKKRGVTPALFHGIKGVSGIEAVREMLRDGTLSAVDDFRAAPVRSIPATGAKTKIYTYYEPVEGISYKESRDMITLWANEWEKMGWKPIVLNEGDAREHPLYRQAKDVFSCYPTVNLHGYDLSCYLRWLAISALGGGWMSDWDLFPANPDELSIKGDITFYSGNQNDPRIPCLVHGTKEGYERAIKHFFHAGHDGKHTSDMVMLCDFDAPVQPGVMEYQEPGWEQAAAIHFANVRMQPEGKTPRSVFVPQLLRMCSVHYSHTRPPACVVHPHSAGLFSLFNNVITCMGRYEHVHVDWTGSLYGPGNVWNNLFEPTEEPTTDYDEISDYPEKWLTAKNAGHLYLSDTHWRENWNQQWKKIKVRPEILERVGDLVVTNIIGFNVVALLVRADGHAGEQLDGNNQELEEYAEEIDKAKPSILYVASGSEEVLEWFRAKYPRVFYHPATKRSATRKTDRHLSEPQDAQDAINVLEEVLIMSRANVLIHPVSNMATAALGMNLNLKSVFLK